jgi:hypothetical protein
MKWIVFFVVVLKVNVSRGQTQEATQLLLNYEKLKQLEEILDNMYKGYKILSQGYNRIKDIAEGNYSLHHVFLDGLLQVSPVVRNYRKIPEIVNYQLRMVAEQRDAYMRFRDDANLTESEISYLSEVYGQLITESLKNLEALTMVITASKLRMNDDERLAAIDRIHADMEDKLVFLRDFNNSTQLLIIQRAKERSGITTLRKLNDVN